VSERIIVRVAGMVQRLPKRLIVLIPASMLAGLVAGVLVDLAPLKVLGRVDPGQHVLRR
jgi:predicted benzoate:H+ symporter BenE